MASEALLVIATTLLMLQTAASTAYIHMDDFLTTVPVEDILAEQPPVTDIRLSGNLISTLGDCQFCPFPALDTLLLARNGLSAVSSTAFSGTVLTRIDLSENALSEVPDFQAVGAYLQAIILDDNDITALPATALQGLTQLVSLSLPGNQLHAAAMDGEAFLPCDNLISLTLSKNDLYELPDLRHLEDTLQNLRLSATKLRKLDGLGALIRAIPGLRVLGLANIEMISPPDLANDIGGTSLVSLSLRSNYFICGAGVAWIKDLGASGTLVGIENTPCVSPARFVGVPWSSISRAQLLEEEQHPAGPSVCATPCSKAGTGKNFRLQTASYDINEGVLHVLTDATKRSCLWACHDDVLCWSASFDQGTHECTLSSTWPTSNSSVDPTIDDATMSGGALLFSVRECDQTEPCVTLIVQSTCSSCAGTYDLQPYTISQRPVYRGLGPAADRFLQLEHLLCRWAIVDSAGVILRLSDVSTRACYPTAASAFPPAEIYCDGDEPMEDMEVVTGRPATREPPAPPPRR